jgi:hypothetical protein
LDLDRGRGRGRDGDEKKNLQKKIFIAITTAIKTQNFQKNPVFPLSVWEGYTQWVTPIGCPKISE